MSKKEQNNKEMAKKDISNSAVPDDVEEVTIEEVRDMDRAFLTHRRKMEKLTEKFNKNIEKFQADHLAIIKSYKSQLDKLTEESVILYDLPDSIENKIVKASPILGENLLGHLENKMDSLIASIKTSTDKAIALEDKIDAAAQKIEGNKMKRFIARVVFVSVIASVIAGGVSYVMLKVHPSTIRLDNAQNIHLQNGEVTLFRADKVHANQMRQRR